MRSVASMVSIFYFLIVVIIEWRLTLKILIKIGLRFR